MKPIFAILVATLAGCTLPAMAQDNDSSWSGPYVGVNVGAGWGTVETTGNTSTTDGTSPVLPHFPATYSGADSVGEIEGWLGGVTAGYNLQSGPIVYGVEADYQITDLSRSDAFLGSPFGPFYETKSKLTDFGTLRARIGYDAGTIMPFIAGGLAVGHGVGTLAVTGGVPGAFSSPQYVDSTKEAYLGFAIGAGAEISVAENVRIKAEYLHLGFGNQGYNFNLQGNGSLSAHTDTNMSADVVRVGLNFSF